MPRNVPGYTILDPVVTDLSQVVMRPVDDGLGGQDLQLSGYYKLRCNDPSIVEIDQLHESASFVLSPAQKTAFVNFLNTNLIPVIKAGEGL